MILVPRRLAVVLSLLLYFCSCLSASLSQELEPRRLLGRGSVAEYPQWIAATEGICTFTFTTASGDGFLFYMDSNGSPMHYIYLRLRGGRIAVDVNVGGAAPLQTVFGDGLADNQPHSVTITHEFSRFDFELDGSEAASIAADTFSSLDTRSHVFIGGLPATYTPDLPEAATDANFAGCIQDTKFANESISSIHILSRSPLKEAGVVRGCADSPCAGVDCGTGVCVSRWTTQQGESFCDCRGTNMAGPSCSLDVSRSTLTLSRETYSCLSIPTDQFYTDYEPVSAVVQLVPPIPQDGTVMTGVSGDKTIRFSLSLESGKVLLKLREGNSFEEVKLSSEMQLRSTIAYQLEVTRNSDEVRLEITEVETLSTFDTLMMTLPSPLDFDAGVICLGGSLLERPNYKGVLRQVYFKQHPLTEASYFNLFAQEITSRSDVINFLPGFTDPSLTFREHGLSSRRIEMEVRSNGSSLILLSSETEPSVSVYSFALTIINDVIILVATRPNNVYYSEVCGSANLIDGKWHSVVLERVRESNPPGLRVIVDDSELCSLMNTSIDMVLNTLSSEPLHFGHTAGGIFTEGVPFEGCLQNIRFVDIMETFRPNLEAESRVESRFVTSSCYYCEMDMCDGEDVCRNVGVSGHQCCPAGFTGESCDTDPEPTVSESATFSSPGPSSSSSPPTARPGTGGPSVAEIGMWVGVALASALGVILLFLGGLCVLTCYQIYSRKQGGFYKTHENQENGQLPHINASLRRVDSQTIVSETNDHHAARGPQKEFYM